MNHFFALELPDEMRQRIAEYCRRWRDLLGPDFPARWHDPADYHITLKFLGDVDASRQGKLIAAAEPVAAQAAPFGLSVNGPGAQPSARFVNVLIGHVYPAEGLTNLHRRIDAAVSSCGIAPDTRGLAPHITVARCSRRPKALVFPHYEANEHPFYKFTARQFVLMQTLPPEARRKEWPVRYNTVHAFPFGGKHS